MKGFLIKTSSVLAVVLVLAGYNVVLEAREKDEEIARLNAQVQALQEFVESIRETEAEGAYADGEWEGEAQGFGGPISVKVTVESGMLTDIEIVSAEQEDKAYLSMAETILPAILEAQSADVDTISGATFSSGGIKNAAAQALEKAER